MKEIRTKTSGGEDVLVKIEKDRISAYRIRKPKLRVVSSRKDGMEGLEKLAESLFHTPVLTISKEASGRRYTVDFDAGFQRGLITGLTKKQIMERIGKIEMYRGEPIRDEEGFIAWIGLDPANPEHKEALEEFLGERIPRAKRKLRRLE